MINDDVQQLKSLLERAAAMVAQIEQALVAADAPGDEVDERVFDDPLSGLRHHEALAYRLEGCRCRECTLSWESQLGDKKLSSSDQAILRINREKALKARGLPLRPVPVGLVHGKLNSYRMGCRCDLCMKANKDYYREYRARRKAAGDPV